MAEDDGNMLCDVGGCEEVGKKHATERRGDRPAYFCEEHYDHPNPYIKGFCGKKGCLDHFCVASWAWDEGNEHGQLHPSPETVKKIQNEAVDNFAEKMKGAITHAIREKRAVTPIPISYDELMEVIDNTQREEKEGDD